MFLTNLTYTGPNDQLLSTNLEGTNAQLLVSTGSGPLDVEVFENHIYWTENNTHKLRRSTLDGSVVEDLFVPTPPFQPLFPVGLAIDSIDRRVYWTNNQASEIRSVNLDGSDPQTISLPNTIKPYALTIDIEGRQLFWTEITQKQIYRSDLDGSNRQLVVQDTGALPTLFGITVDPVDEKIYWTNSDQDRIRRANFDGTGIETIVNGPRGSTYRDLEIDPISRMLYWVDDHKDAMEQSYIMRANLNGTGVENLATFIGQTVGIAIGVPEPSIACLLIGSLACLGAFRKQCRASARR